MCIVSDVLDNLENFRKVNAHIKYACFRTDKVYNIEKDDFINFSNILCKKFIQDETTFDGYLDALGKALSYFKEFGCQISDQGLFIPFWPLCKERKSGERFI